MKIQSLLFCLVLSFVSIAHATPGDAFCSGMILDKEVAIEIQRNNHAVPASMIHITFGQLEEGNFFEEMFTEEEISTGINKGNYYEMSESGDEMVPEQSRSFYLAKNSQGLFYMVESQEDQYLLTFISPLRNVAINDVIVSCEF